MWHEGWTAELVAWLLNALALTFGAALGARGLFDPHWAARFVRLKPDDAQAGGFAEFRATYGGVFLGLHGAALLTSVLWIAHGATVMGMYATGAAFVLGAGWAGASAGRLLAVWRDGARTDFNLLSAGVEALMALLIGAPWLQWWFHRPG